MKLESIKIKNFKALRNVKLSNIPDLAIFLGANGTGKSTFLNVFDFLKEAIKTDVHTALLKHGGVKGFDEVRSRGSKGDIHIEIDFILGRTIEEDPFLRTYLMSIGKNAQGHVIVKREVLQYKMLRDSDVSYTLKILDFKKGVGKAVVQEKFKKDFKKGRHPQKWKSQELKLKSPDTLALKGLAQFERFPGAILLWEAIDRWHFSDIHVDQARRSQAVKSDLHLSSSGDNLHSVIERYRRKHPKVMEEIKKCLQRQVPGVADVETQAMETGDVLLKIKDKFFEEPFLSDHVSHGTIKMLAYLVLLYDPDPHDFLFLEEPENQLYPSLLEELTEEFRDYARRRGHVFVSTHSPDFLNAAEVNEVFLFVKKEGFTTIVPAAKDKQVKRYMDNGDKMGHLWKQGFFRGVDPR